jgi:peptidyl-Lys metalloendopeptidase
LSTKNFEEFVNEKEKRETCAIIYSDDSLYKVKVGDMFWKTGTEGEILRSGTIIHELSHFESIGGTEDVVYGEKDCLELAIKDPAGALKNADSFQFFVIV